MSTTGRVHVGLKWISVAQALTQGVRFFSTIVLARLLVPEMFGLVAMANVAITMLGVLRQLGFGAAYVQRRSADEAEDRLAASTMFWIQLAINALLFLVAMALVPWITQFFRSPELAPILRALLLTFLIDAACTAPSMILQKRLEFGRLATCDIAGSLSNAAIAIPLALSGFGAWSLVFGQLGASTVFVVLTVRIARWRPTLEFSRHIARQLFAYGKFLWGFGVLSAVGDSLDRLLIGRWLGASTVGIYSLAFGLSKLPSTQISVLVNRITFPAYAELQGNRPVLRRAFLKTLSHVSILSVPLAFGMLAVAPELVLTLYGEKWLDAAPIIQVLAFYGMVLSVASPTGSVFQAIGKPQVLLYTSIVHHTLQVALLMTLGRYGVIGIAYAILIPLLVSSTIGFVLVALSLELRPRQILAPLIRVVVASGAMYASVLALRGGWSGPAGIDPAPALASAVALGALVYLLASAVVNRATLVEFSVTLKRVVTARRELA